MQLYSQVPDCFVLLGQQQSAQVIHSQVDVRVQQQTWQMRVAPWAFESEQHFPRAVRFHDAPLTRLLRQQCEHRRGRDLQAGVALHQSGEHHAAQRQTEGGKHVLLCRGGRATHRGEQRKEATVRQQARRASRTGQSEPYRSQGCSSPTGWTFELLPVMSAGVNTANREVSPRQANWPTAELTLVLPSGRRTWTTGSFLLLTCDLLLYCSTSEGSTAAITMWLALLEALQAACSSLALGHTSFRSGSHRWCLQSDDTWECLEKQVRKKTKGMAI